MDFYTDQEIKIHSAGRRLQSDLPFYRGLAIGDLVSATKLGWGTVCSAIERLEQKGKATSRKTAKGHRSHGSIRFKGRIPVRKSK